MSDVLAAMHVRSFGYAQFEAIGRFVARPAFFIVEFHGARRPSIDLRFIIATSVDEAAYLFGVWP